MTTKPICVVSVDFEKMSSQGNRKSVYELQDMIQERMLDYHVFVIPVDDPAEVMSLQVFYEKDFTEIQYEELKKLISDELKSKQALKDA